MTTKISPQTGVIGGLPGAGRTPKALQLKNYEKVLRLLDDTVEEAFAVIRNDLQNPDPYVRIRCAEIILKKYLPDKKIKEISGTGGGPIEITNVDKRAVIISMVDILDELEIDEIKKKAEDGDFRLLEPIERRETEEEGTVGEEGKTES